MSGPILCLDSSTPAGSVALVSGQQVLAEVTLNVKHRCHSDYLLRYIQFVLAQTGLNLGDLHGLAVVVGPGSFTGLRVGIATVQGLAQALNLPVYPLSSLQVVAFANGPVTLPVQVLIDARKHEVYTARYLWQQGVPLLKGSEQVVAPHLLAAMIETPTLLVGNGAFLYREMLLAACPETAILGNVLHSLPSAAAAGILVDCLPQRTMIADVFNLLPVYIRPSDAELQKKAI